MISTTIIVERVEARFCATPNSPIGQVADKLIKLQQGMLLLQPNNQTIKQGIANLTNILCKPGETMSLFGNQSSTPTTNLTTTNMTAPNTAGNVTTSQIQYNNATHMSFNPSNMKQYTDPQGRYSIYYPTNWTVTPATNRFQTILVTFSSVPYESFSVVVVPNGGTTDPAVTLNYNTNPFNIPLGMSIFQNTECVKYRIDGQKSCSIIFTGTLDTNSSLGPLVFEQVATYVDGRMFAFNMWGTQGDFDRYLPTFDNMVASFKAPGAYGNSTSA